MSRIISYLVVIILVVAVGSVIAVSLVDLPKKQQLVERQLSEDVLHE